METISKILIVGLNDEMFNITRSAWANDKATSLYHAETVADGIRALSSGTYHLVSVVLPPETDERIYFVNHIRVFRDLTAAPISVMMHDPYDTALKIKVIDEGADDIQVCPPSIEEAVATAKAMIRRYTELNNGREKAEIVQKGSILINLGCRKTFIHGHEVELLPKEFDIFTMLVKNQGRVFTHEQIFNVVWGEDYVDSSRDALWSQMKSLRKKIQVNNSLPNFIKTKYSIGYSFDPQY